MNHASEREIFRRGLASQAKWSMASESQNSKLCPKLSGGKMISQVVIQQQKISLLYTLWFMMIMEYRGLQMATHRSETWGQGEKFCYTENICKEKVGIHEHYRIQTHRPRRNFTPSSPRNKQRDCNVNSRTSEAKEPGPIPLSQVIFYKNYAILKITLGAFLSYPHSMHSITTGDKNVTYNACFTQIFFIILTGATEFFLLSAMCYDRYVAICKPLHYTTIMNERVCTILVLCCWVIGLIVILPPLSLGLQLDFCNSNLIDHFFCDAYPLLKIICSDTQFIEQLVLIMAVLTLIGTLVCVIMSYTYIIKTILRLPSAQQRNKAFSTCSSHMIVVSITYGSCIFMYVKPAKEGVAINKVVSLLNTSVIPLMNPFIYTLRNKQVKQALKDSIKKMAFFSKD
ncbi:olfactory receptor 6C2-like [Suricata suricatta]|uniref:olfactory receptor 6C2-like n=1 Tax=Suricata suricatta TaxID=37032 RepID=UPI001155A2B7|nr:olfactory receptor 6C2-like [Suricata suricatta]